MTPECFGSHRDQHGGATARGRAPPWRAERSRAPSARDDRGISRAIRPEIAAKLIAAKRQKPRRSIGLLIKCFVRLRWVKKDTPGGIAFGRLEPHGRVAGDRGVGLVRHYPHVAGLRVLEEIEDAVLLEQPADEGEVGLPVLHTIVVRA